MLKLLMNLLEKFFSSKKKNKDALEQIQLTKELNQEIKKILTKEEKMEIDWSNPKSKISKHFTVHEATFLPSWRVYHKPSEEEKKELIKTAKKMDILRDRIGKACIIHVWIRPKKANCEGHERHGQDYNVFIGSTSKKSAHIFGRGVDFHFSGFAGPKGCSEIREKIKPWLEELDIRMEDIQGGWIHIDTNPVGYRRFFKP